MAKTREILKSEEKRRHNIIYKGTKIIWKAELPTETEKPEDNGIVVLRQINCQPRILESSKISLKSKDEKYFQFNSKTGTI